LGHPDNSPDEGEIVCEHIPLPKSSAPLIIPILINGFKVRGFVDNGSSHSQISLSWARKVGLRMCKQRTDFEQFVAGSKGRADYMAPCVNLAVEHHRTQLNMMVGRPAYHNCEIVIGRDVLSELGIRVVGLPTDYPKALEDMVRAFHAQSKGEFDETFWDETFRLQTRELTLSEEAVATSIRSRVQAKLDRNAQLPFDTKCHLPEAVVILDTGDAPPVSVAPYRMEKDAVEAVNQKIEEWKEWVIEEAPPGTKWNFSLLVVRKKDAEGRYTKKRVCIDIRKLNALLPSDSYPMPVIGDILTDLGGKKLYTILDLKDGYHHFVIHEDSREKTAFKWGRKQYMFRRAPFGIKHLPALFQRVLDRILGDLSFVHVYVDDIVVFSDSVDEHVTHLGIVIDRLTEAGLHIQSDKCHIGVPVLRVLGHTVSTDGVSPDREKVMELLELPQPRSLKDLQSFMGLANFFSSYVPSFAQLCAPINRLRGAAVAASFDWAADWTDELLEAFVVLKENLKACMTLSFPDWSKPFFLATDASTVGIGGVLYQLGDSEGEYKYIQFMSRSLSKSERQYSATKLELTAIIYCLKRCSYYLFGRRFTIQTDHKALTYMLTQKDLSPLLSRWYEHIMAFDFEIEHIPGVRHVLPDALSRLYPDYARVRPEDEDAPPVTFMALDVYRGWRGDFAIGDNYMLDRMWFRKIDEAWGPHSVDLFAHLGNAQVKRFCGQAKPRKRKYSPYTYLGKPFELDWAKENAYAFPPVALINEVLDKVNELGARITLLTPLDSRASWYLRCVDMALELPIPVPFENMAFFGRATNYTHRLVPPWGNAVLWRVTAAPTRQDTSFAQRLQKRLEELLQLEDAFMESVSHVRASDATTMPTLKARYQCDDAVASVSDDIAEEEMPGLADRSTYALLAHLQGHVGANDMVLKLREQGFDWPKMKELCQDVIRRCGSCQVNKRENPKFHKMQTMTATMPMDHVAIDCHSMSVPSGKYSILLSIVDICTKFVWIRALRDKQGHTVARALWKVFANFGFPKIIQSDNGTEFVNQVVDSLKEVSSMDSRLTTPYHPRANGSVERSFRTIMDMVLVLVEGTVRDWYHMIPQVQLWMNLRSSAVHGFTPFSLMFSRPFVGFKDFTNTPIEMLTPEQLEKRYNLAMSWLYPKSAAKVSLTASKRISKYNAKRGVCNEPFPDGSYVMVKNPRRENKMGQRYLGPYRVLRRTQGGSYVLLDEAGQLLPRNVAPSHLKLVSYESIQNALDAGDVSVAPAEAIVLHRGTPGHREFKVRWAGCDADEDTWEVAANLDQRLIRKYWDRVQSEEVMSTLAGSQGDNNEQEPNTVTPDQGLVDPPILQDSTQHSSSTTSGPIRSIPPGRRQGAKRKAGKKSATKVKPSGFLEGLVPKPTDTH
jgi:transposase InsO family protein